MDSCQRERGTISISREQRIEDADSFSIVNGDCVTDARLAASDSFSAANFAVQSSAVTLPDRQKLPDAATTELSDFCYIHELQDEIIFILLSFLGPPASSFRKIGSLSRRLRAAVTNERLWEEFFTKRFKDKIHEPKICAERALVKTSVGLGDKTVVPSAAPLGCACRLDLAVSPLRCSKRDPAYSTGSDFRVSPPTYRRMEASGASFSTENSLSPPLFPCGGFRELTLLPELPTREEATFSRRSSSDSVLDNALECMGVPSGGKCWRGKYLLKHSLERKFAKAQFDLQRTWFVDSPALRPSLPDGEAEATEDTRSQSSRSSDSFSLDGSPSSGDGGNSQEREDGTSSPLLPCTSARHGGHPRHLCHYRHPHAEWPSASAALRVRPAMNAPNPSTSGLSSAPSSGGAPPVCVLSLRFFGDGAGLLYAARAGGIEALCPDRGCHLRTFSLRRRGGGREAGRRARREETQTFAGRQLMTRERIQWDPNGIIPRQAGEESRDEHPCQMFDARFVSGSSEESDQDSENEEPDEAGSRLDRRGSEAVGGVERRNLREAGGLERPAFALCVADTIDDALGRCEDARNNALASQTRMRLAESANFERQRPLVIGGYSDGKIGVWDYCHPDRVLEHLEVTTHRHRGPSAVKSVCAIAGGLAGRGGCDILAGAEDGGVALLNADRLDIGIVQRLRGHTAAIQSIACERESGLVFTASRDRLVHVFDIRAGDQPVASCGRHHDWAMCVHVPDGSGTRIFETADRAVHTWDLRRLLGDSQQAGADRGKTAKALAERHRHKQLISGMRLDAFRLVSCSLDGCVLLSSLENRELGTQDDNAVGQHTDFSVLRRGGETQWMLGVDFAETKMATSTVDGAIQIYHLLHLHTLPRCFLYT
ncbi:conserved hypothetical protein [Neospora caninum Liverpool]|uniref:Uncharacterized protein n=1 Tax=Neospora caninum (strain Liverpool) TaxID=572307 RepID=F0VEZ3_NEOCL|nr:conserved hypothetical protein [Neospora caninum Liverpool]CBZ52287.1 conserved hypothetical protein [Neospora caninum Liverpool]|eukprot:XP_003882319.1 conserved hypothetical protein [Neospora caninum Liverpool]